MRVPSLESWTVPGDDDLPVGPVERYLAYLTDIERSPNTVVEQTGRPPAYASPSVRRGWWLLGTHLPDMQSRFYLASWGMFRSSTGLRSRSVRQFRPVVELIAEAPPDIWSASTAEPVSGRIVRTSPQSAPGAPTSGTSAPVM
jgi:hypothetical protein